MASFKDRQGQEWSVNLDPVIALEIQEKHSIEIANLKTDPMMELRSNPMTLVSVMHLICQEQIQQRNLTPEQFAKCLPFPPDDMLRAVQEAIISFFPTGRASHVREVLAGYENMGSKTDELTTVKMQMMLENPMTMDRISKEADRQIEKALTNLHGT